RLRPSLEESTQSVCPRCNGTGNVRSVESLALAILRLIGEEARKERTAKVIAQLPVDVSNYLLNEKREWVQTIQERNNVQIVLIGNPDMETPNYSIKRVRDDEANLPENSATSYKMVEPKEDPSLAYEEIKRAVKVEEAAVSKVLPATPAPVPPPPPQPAKRSEPSIWQRMFGWLNGGGAAEPEESKPRERQARGKAASTRGRDARAGNSDRRRGDRERTSSQRRSRGGRAETNAQGKQSKDGGNGQGAKSGREQNGAAAKSARDQNGPAARPARDQGGGKRNTAPNGNGSDRDPAQAAGGRQAAQEGQPDGSQAGTAPGTSRRRSRGRRRGSGQDERARQADAVNGERSAAPDQGAERGKPDADAHRAPEAEGRRKHEADEPRGREARAADERDAGERRASPADERPAPEADERPARVADERPEAAASRT